MAGIIPIPNPDYMYLGTFSRLIGTISFAVFIEFIEAFYQELSLEPRLDVKVVLVLNQ